MTTAETRVTDWVAFGHYGLTHYRIWQRMGAFGQQQRHDWKKEDGSIDIGEWIDCPRWGWTVGAKVIQEERRAA